MDSLARTIIEQGNEMIRVAKSQRREIKDRLAAMRKKIKVFEILDPIAAFNAERQLQEVETEALDHIKRLDIEIANAEACLEKYRITNSD